MHQPVMRPQDRFIHHIHSGAELVAAHARSTSESALMFLVVCMLWGLVLYIAIGVL